MRKMNYMHDMRKMFRRLRGLEVRRIRMRLMNELVNIALL